MLLFEITTSRVRVVWSGVPRAVVGMEGRRRRFGLRVATLDGGTEGDAAARPRVRVSKTQRVLTEETTYTLFVQSLDGSPVALSHDDPVLVAALQQPAPGLLHGPLRVGSQVGQAGFGIRLGGRPHLFFQVEIVPTKLDYRRDYHALVQSVAHVAGSLALRLVTPTRQPMQVAPAPGDALTEALLLDALADRLDAALERAFRQPLQTLRRTPRAAAVHQIRPARPGVVRALAQHPGAEMLAAPVPTWRLDTPEHAWIAARLRGLDTRLARRVRLLPATPRGQAARLRLETLRRRLARWLATPPLAAVPPRGVPAPATLRLARAPGYREAARLLGVLGGRLGAAPGPLPFRLRDLHQLFEFACFLSTVEALARATGYAPPPEALVEWAGGGLDLRFKTGRNRLAFPLGGGGRLVLRYVPRLAAPGALLPQRPDLLLTRLAPGQPPRRYVLDAKYRLDASPAALARYGHPAPPASALGVLHRYRDAIVERGGGRRVVQAAVLYPWRDDGRYAGGRLARALGEIGVGAIPVLPGATHVLDAWIARIVAGDDGQAAGPAE